MWLFDRTEPSRRPIRDPGARSRSSLGIVAGAFGLVLALGFGGPALAQQDNTAFVSGDWRGAAFGDNGGHFARCVITSEFPGQPTLGFGRESRGRFEVWLLDPRQNYQEGHAEVLTLQVDGNEPVSGRFMAVGPDRLAAQVDGVPGLVESFMRGNVLKITPAEGGATLSYPLKGTFKAITALDQCARDFGNVQVTTAAKPSGGGNSGGNSQAQAQARAQEALQKLAAVKGDTLYKLSPQDFAARIVLSDPESFQIPEDLKQAKDRLQADLVWRIPDGFGIAKAVRGSPTEEELRTELVARREPSCQGELTSQADMRVSSVKDRVIKRVEVGCTQDGQGNPAYEAFAFYPHESGNLIMIVHFARSGDLARAADDRFFQIVESVSAGG